MRIKLPILLILTVQTLFSFSQDYDLVITNGMIMDGTGNPWYYGDVAVKDGVIVKVGNFDGRNSERVIDAGGLTVVPGFVDIHSHADDYDGNEIGIRSEDLKMRAAHNLVMQGITTVVINQDGRSQPSIAQQIEEIKNPGVGPNVALMVGHNSIRFAVLGEDHERPATDEEIDKMKVLITQGMNDGAFGLSAGLEYIPGRWSTTEEVTELVGTVKPFGGVYILHERSSGSDPMWYLPSRRSFYKTSATTMLENIKEIISVAESTGVTSCATHLKVRGADFWGASEEIVRMINEARSRGVDVWADQYPYNTSGTDGNTVVIPDWAIGRDRWRGSLTENVSASEMNYANSLDAVLSDEEKRKSFELDVNRELERRGGPDNIVVFEYPDESFVGRSIAEISKELDLSPLEVIVKMQMEGYKDRPGGANMRGFSMSENDLEAFAQQPWLITASDAGVAHPNKERRVHARFYGTFPRKISWYAKSRGVISVEHAVRSSTSLPAQFMGFKDRGMIREGFMADITILDMNTIKDKATFEFPHQYPEGVEYVVVNGVVLVDKGELTDELPGQIISIKESFRYDGE